MTRVDDDREVLLFFTGGTSGMRPMKDGPGVAPADAFGRLMVELSEAVGRPSLRALEWADVPSPHLTPEDMFRLARDVDRELRRPSVQGAVVIHGTDTMEETAFLTDLTLCGEAPVVFTGSMRYYGEMGYDGLRNLFLAIKACASPDMVGLGATVLMADRVFAAAEATKVHSTGIDPFEAPGLGPLGNVAEDGLHLIRGPAPRRRIRPDRIEPNVDLIKISPGMDDRFILASRDKGAAGLVLEGFGAGNIPPGLIPALKKTIEDGTPVILTTRCAQGGVRPIYGYPGGAADLKKLGLIFGGRLSGQKARIQLMLALGLTRDPERLKAMFESESSTD